jgi:hypothetical protein
MQTRRIMLLDYEAAAVRRGDGGVAVRLDGFGKIALGAIGGKLAIRSHTRTRFETPMATLEKAIGSRESV